MKTWKKRLLILALIVGGVLVANTPASLDYSPAFAADRDLSSMLDEPASLLVPGTEKKLTWRTNEQLRTEWSVVALHGFSATRQETAPLAELVASKLGANLFETRFTAHGLKENALVDVSAEEWLDDLAEALTIGQAIGEKTLVLAVSNGATVAVAMLDHPSMQSVDTMILLSPNFGLADPKSMWITNPGGPLLLKLMSGTTHSWIPANEQQALYWTTSYPTSAFVEVIRVVNRANHKVRTVTAPRLQLLFSPNDDVVSVPALREAYAALRSPDKEIVEVTETSEESTHVIAGDIMSPENTAPLAAQIVDFTLRQVP